jgi:hypothetical protein
MKPVQRRPKLFGDCDEPIPASYVKQFMAQDAELR